jgi:uncharacterized protein
MQEYKKIIVNTSPLIALKKIESLYLLEKLYGQIIIPMGVYEEIISGQQQGLLEIFVNDNIPEWIKVKQLKNEFSSSLLYELDKGEKEVIIMGKELNADLLVLDENVARNIAELLNLNITGTLGILLLSKEQKLIKSIKYLMDELRSKSFWISNDVYNSILKYANE